MIVRTCVVIPAYNNTSTISDVVKGVVLKTRFPVLIVDDGSQTPVTDSLYSWDVKKAMTAGRVRVVRFAKRQGRGAALRFAIRDLVQQGFTHMVTMDGDGQYPADQIAKLAEQAKKNPWSLVIGERKNNSSFWIARLGRRLTNAWVSYQTGFDLHDTQSGFRMYPLIAVQGASFLTRQSDWELEVLIRLLWHGVDVQETEIVSVEKADEDAGSRFQQLWDSLRFAVLFSALATIALLKGHRSPGRLSVALGAGVLIGFTPWLHWHFAMVLGLALLLRLNGVAMAIGTLVSSPPLLSFTLLSSIYVGQQWLGIQPAPGAHPHAPAWLWGGLLVGSIVGSLFAAFSYFILRYLTRSEVWTQLKPFYRGLSSYYQRNSPSMGYWRRQNEILRHAWGILRVRAAVVPRKKSVQVEGREALHAEVDRHARVHLLTAQLSGTKAVLKHAGLSHNSYVGWQADGDSGGKVELIRFFGRLAPFDVSVFESAISTKIPVFYCFAFGSAYGPEKVILRGPKSGQLNPGVTKELQIYAWMEKFVTELEAFLRKNPRVWGHSEDFWTIPSKGTRGPHILFEELPLPDDFDSGWTRDEQFTVQV